MHADMYVYSSVTLLAPIQPVLVNDLSISLNFQMSYSILSVEKGNKAINKKKKNWS